MREACTAFRFGGPIQLIQCLRKGFRLLRCQHAGQIFIKRSLNLRLGGFQAFRLFRGIQAMKAFESALTELEELLG